MSDLNTFGIEENKLQLGNNNLKNHTNHLKGNIIKAKQLLNGTNDLKLIEYFKLIEESVIPVLDKYSNKMDDVLIDAKQVEKETL